MTYRSNPFDKQDYSKFAFKKSELLAVLQAIDENFSFDSIAPSEPVQIQENPIPKNQTSFNDYKTLLFKKPLLSTWDAASIISDTDPLLLRDLNEYEAGKEYPNWMGAFNFIDSSIEAGLLKRNDFGANCIKRDNLKQFLSSQDIIIDGFNNSLPTQEYTEFGQPSIQQNEPSTESLNAEILRLGQIITEKDIEIQKLKKDIEKERMVSFESWLDQAKAEKETIELQEHIKKLETDKAVEKSEPNDLLAMIFDESATERYSPDLVLSIKLWEHVYIVNPKGDSHSNKADTWLKANTGYDVDKKAGSASKIREVTTPFKFWSPHRDKNHKK